MAKKLQPDELSKKIENTEKLGLEEVKTKACSKQKEDYVAPQKLKKTLNGVYKKYKIQEMRLEELDEKRLLARLKERYASAPAFVLTKAEGNYYVSEPIGKSGEIKRIAIEKRGAGGIAQELLIETEKATYKVLSEYNIRYVLCDGKSAVTKQDGSETVPGTLLPSGFLCWIPSAGLEKTEKMW